MAGSMLAADVASATTYYVYTTHQGGAAGKKVTISGKFPSGPSGDHVPCRSAEADVTWATGGKSWGMARDQDSSVDHVWVSVRSQVNEAGCGATGGKYCLGAAYADVSSGSITQSWSATPVSGAPTIVDVAGWGTSGDAWIVADKSVAGAGNGRWRLGGSGVSEDDLAVTEPTQVFAVDGSLFVGTNAGKTSCTVNSTGGSNVTLYEWSSGNITSHSSYAVATDDFKPEGVYVRSITSSAGCPYDAMAYVTDYCGASGSTGRLYTFGIDASAKTLTLEDTDNLPSGCKPSNVTFHDPSGKAFVLCQSGSAEDSIVDVTFSDECTPTVGASATELKHATSGVVKPTCSLTPALTGCNAGGDPTCSPHDFGWIASPAWMADWLVVTLTGVNQAIVVKADDLSKQYGLYLREGESLDPLELELVSTP